MTSDILNAATQEAYASAREGVRWYDTLELYHSDWASVLRIVNDTQDFTGVLESNAPNNPGASVTFDAFGFSVQMPTRDEEGRKDFPMTIDNVSLEVFDLLQTHDASNGPVHVIFRIFVNTDPNQPGRVWATTIKSININSKSVVLNCLFADYVNRRFPTLTYDSANFPGLFR